MTNIKEVSDLAKELNQKLGEIDATDKQSLYWIQNQMNSVKEAIDQIQTTNSDSLPNVRLIQHSELLGYSGLYLI